MTADPDALFPEPKTRANTSRGGPVYQGICAQIRALTTGTEPLIDKKLWAGTIAQARSLAASIDRVDGHANFLTQANGVPLSLMHERLDALMARLNPDADDQSPLERMADAWRKEEEESRARSAAEAPHPQV